MPHAERFSRGTTMAKRFLLLTALIAAAATMPWTLAARQPANPVVVRAGDTVTTGGFLFDSVGDTVVPNRGIVVRGGVFQSVGARLDGVDLAGANVVRLTDSDYVLPGFFDLYAHYAMDLFGQGRVDEYTV